MNELDSKKAIEYFDKSLEIDDSLAQIWLYKALMHLMNDDEEGFDRSLEKAVELDPEMMLTVNKVMDNFIERM